MKTYSTRTLGIGLILSLALVMNTPTGAQTPAKSNSAGDNTTGTTASAPRFTHKQKNVDYNLLPDADNIPPVKRELGIPNGNSANIRTATGQARSKGFARSNEAGNDAADDLPDHWNNALTKYFPPFFYQMGPSCMGSAFTGYMFTHELNALRGLDGSLEDNQMAVFFGWLLTYQYTSKEDVEMYNGCPSATDYGGRTSSDDMAYCDWRASDAGWMQGYEKWHRAMYNRAEGFYTFPLTVATEEGRTALKRWLYNHNGDTDFLTGGVCYITVGAASPTGYIKSTPANEAAGVVGQKYIQEWAASMNHAMTIIGYDDRIEFDLDEDGIYGEADADEKGAWIVANSWGAYWGNGGWAYVPYRYGGITGKVTSGDWWNPYVTYARKNYRPKRTIKLLMDYDHRSELALSVGVSPDTAATAAAYKTDMVSFKNNGDGAEDRTGGAPAVPMLGRYVDGLRYEPMEFGYDLTDLSSAYDNSQPLKYFFNVRLGGKKGLGHIYKASIIDYNLNTSEGVEIPFNIDTIALDPNQSTTYSISVVVPGEQINAPLNAALSGRTLTWDAPQPTTLRLRRYYIYQDGVKTDSVTGTRSYLVNDTDGVYSVSAGYDYVSSIIESEQSNSARNAVSLPSGDNLVLRANNGSLVIPNAIERRLTEGTIEFWIKPHSIGSTSNRLTGSRNDKFFFCITASGQAQAGWSADNAVTSAARTIKANTWTHIAFVVKNNQLTLYINGMKKGSGTATMESGIPALGDVLFGTEGCMLNADIDELRIWKTARTQIQIFANKDNGIANPTAQADLLAYLPMNTINYQGQTRLQEYIRNNHAYLVDNDLSCVADASILKGGTFSQKPSITLPDSLYIGTSFRIEGDASLKTVDWAWSLPGASPSAAKIQSPNVIYSQEGEHTATLIVTDANGKQDTVRKTFSVAKASLPVPEFDLSTTRQEVGKTISLINRTRTPYCTYKWEAQGQAPISMTNANIAFRQDGIYTVTLTATNSAGSASLSKTVEIYNASPTSTFSVSPNHILLGEATYLEDKSQGNPSTWIWTLSNGHRYTTVDGRYSSITPTAPGFYDVSLQTQNEEGANILTRQRALVVSNADAENGLNFTGNAEQVRFPRPFADNQQTFTLEWWMNPAKLQGAGGFEFGPLTAACTQANRYEMKLGTRTFNFSGFLTQGQWHHYALTFDHGNITLYVDGKKGSSYDASRYYTVSSWGDTFSIGQTNNPMNAYIDELRIWDKALSEQDIQSVCNQPIADPANTDGLCLYYDFNQNGGNVIDRTGHGYDGTRHNFGPDGDAWITQVGVFTLDFGTDIEAVNVTDQYFSNYKRPFLYDNVSVNLDNRRSAKLFQTQSEQSGWIFRSPVVIKEDSVISTVYVDTLNNYDLYASANYGFGNMQDKRLWQTVSLPQGHYRFSILTGSSYVSPGTSRIVACIGDSIVGNLNIDKALISALIDKSKQIEFDVPSDGANVSLGILYNLGGSSGYDNIGIREFQIERITSTTQLADDVHSAYDAVSKGLKDNICGERGAVRIVSDQMIEVRAYTADGRCVFNQYVSGNKRIPLPAGIYIVNGRKVKVE